jgi:hypothetical protein
MRNVIRWGISLIAMIHGLLHLLGADDSPGWLVAAVLVAASGVLLAASVAWWWILGGVAVVLSQTMILTSWSQAKAGTVGNAVLAVAVLHGFLSQGPTSARAKYRCLADDALSRIARRYPATEPVVAESALSRLPGPVAGYVRASGAVGRPQVRGFRARISGRIRSGPDKPWMVFTGEQVNTYGPEPARVFFMDATMFGLPVDVLHDCVDGRARMRVKMCSVLPMVNASGATLDQAETVTLLNDLCVLAPAALVDAPIDWSVVDAHRVRASFTNGPHTVQAELLFNDDNELVDFVSDDRAQASADGRSFNRRRWSTPIGGYRDFAGRRIGAVGAARWQDVGSGGGFTYLEFHLDALTCQELT